MHPHDDSDSCLIETLIDLGAEEVVVMQYLLNTRSCRCGYCSKVFVFAWKGETEEEYEWCLDQTIKKDACFGMQNDFG